MSEVQKPTVEEQVVAPAPETTIPPTTTEAPVVEPVEEPKVEEPVAATEPAVETPAVVVEEPTAEATTEAAPVAKEVTPVEEGVLGYKGPGLLKSFIFQKKHFWFGSEPVEHKNLSSYLRGEKPDVANHNAAWSSHTGNGLLFFSKKASDKASPAGILNLSEASDVSEDGTVDFFFSIHGHKHTFQAANVAERDNWVATLKTKIAEAKEISESVKESETYKTSIAALAKPFSGAATPKKEAKEEKKEEKAEAKAEKKEEKAEAKEEQKEENAEAKAEAKEEKKEEKAELKAEKKDRKSRSASRKGDKRTSIFGALPGFGKKEEKTEAPKDEVVASPSTEEPVVASDASPAPVVDAPVATEALATTEEAAIAPAVEEPVAAAAPVEKPVEKPVPTKRNSIFGTLQSRFSNKKPEPEAVSPVVAAKDEEPVSENAPVIPAVDTTEPLATNADASAPAETTEVPTINGETPKAAETPMTKADKRKSSLPWLSKKDKSAATSDEETEKPKSPFAKLRATVKSKSSPKTDKTAEKPLEPTVEAKAEDKIDEETVATEAEAEAAPAATEPVVSEPVVAAPTSTTPQVSATA